MLLLEHLLLMASKLDNNQKYVLIRRSLVYFFAKCVSDNDYSEYHISDFEPVMKFVGDCYKSYYELRENTQKGL